MKLQQGLRVGAVWVLLCLGKQLHIVDALGAGRQAKLALWQIMARIIEHSSRLSAVRLARSHAVCDLLDLDSFNEDDLYANLDWLHENQTGKTDWIRSIIESKNITPILRSIPRPRLRWAYVG